MFIKRILTLALGCLLLGCAKENVPASQPVQVNLKGSGDCLSALSENFSKFQKGGMNDSEVRSFWGCVQKAVQDYQRLTAGDRADGDYSPQAVRGFLQRYFLKTQGISDPLLMSIMEIKRVLLSGRSSSITAQELALLQDLIDLLKELSTELNPHVKIVFMHSPQASDEQVRLAGEMAEKALRRLGEWLSRHEQTYTFTQMRELMRHLKDFNVKDGESATLFSDLERVVEVLPATKQILIHGDRDAIQGGEWSRLTTTLGLGLRSLLSLRYAFKEDLNSALVRDVVPEGFLMVAELLERGAAAHEGNEIPLAEWGELFTQLERAGWLSEPFVPKNLMRALQWTLDRALGNGEAAPAEAMTSAHLKRLTEVLGHWNLLQRNVLSQSVGAGPVADKFQKTLAASAPQEWDELGRMAFPQRPARRWSRDSTRRMVWPFVVINWLKEAYAGSEVHELNDEQMTVAATEILGVLQGFGWMMDTKVTIGKKLLRESDLFTLASNGNGFIDLYEATRYLAFVASSFRAAQVWLDQAQLVCGDRQAECVREVGADLTRDILDSMPRLKKWLKKDTLKRFAAYTKAGEETILDQVVEGEFSTGQLMQVWMIFQYVETFLLRFDRDFSESVSLNESSPAFELFGPTLGNLLAGVGLPPDEVFVFFTFMMKYGDTPFTMYGGQILYNHWKWHRNRWAFEAERTNLMGILNQLSKL